MYLSVTQNRVQRSNASMANLNSMNILTIKMLRMILQYGKKTNSMESNFFTTENILIHTRFYK